MTRIPRSVILALATALMALPAGAQSSISADGVVESKAGGFKFPDGSVQQAAAVPVGDCPTMDPSDEMIWVNGVCIDKYEASIWDAPVGGNQIIATTETDYCHPLGQDCDDIYARSVPGVEPARFVTWLQAQQALANAGKRLITNAEWQMAVRGTPDDTNCNVDTGLLADTGAHPGCISDWGVVDMVGNLYEWVADWLSEGALLRGGNFGSLSFAGPFASTTGSPTVSDPTVGFRGAR